MSTPFKWMVPLSGSSNPAIMRSTVVLPEPDGPSKVMNSPDSISIETLSAAFTVPKFLQMPRSSTSATAKLYSIEHPRRPFAMYCANRAFPDHDMISFDIALYRWSAVASHPQQLLLPSKWLVCAYRGHGCLLELRLARVQGLIETWSQ